MFHWWKQLAASSDGPQIVVIELLMRCVIVPVSVMLAPPTHSSDVSRACLKRIACKVVELEEVRPSLPRLPRP